MEMNILYLLCKSIQAGSHQRKCKASLQTYKNIKILMNNAVYNYFQFKNSKKINVYRKKILGDIVHRKNVIDCRTDFCGNSSGGGLGVK